MAPSTLFPAPNSPAARAKLRARMEGFFQHRAQHTEPQALLQVYWRALGEWVEDPNTDLYQAERLLDDLHHAAERELPGDGEEETAGP